MKKVLLFIFSLVFSINSFSQEIYVCSGDLSPFGKTGVQMKTYERTGDYFTKTDSKGEKGYFYIIEDNESFLTLIESTSSFPSVFITFIDKKNKTFYENYFYETSDPSHPMTGSWIRID